MKRNVTFHPIMPVRLGLASLVLALTTSCANALNAPSNLTASTASSSQINLAWHDNSGHEAGFQIFRCRDGVNYNKVAAVGRNVTTYSATGLLAGTRYYFKVRAFNSSVTSPFSNVSAAATQTPIPTPTPSPTVPPTPTPSPPSPTPTPTPSASPSPTITPSPTPPISDGIASRYPGDKNIALDPAVILADDFEVYISPSQLTTKWDGARPLQNLRIATEPENVFAGNKSLEMSLPISTSETVDLIRHHFSPEQDTVFIRAYCKFDPGYSLSTSNHNGLNLQAKYPGAGKTPPADGTGFFLFLVQNNIMGTPDPGESAPGFTHIYAYWPRQRTNYGDHWYPDGNVVPGGAGDWLRNPSQYPDFKPMPNFLPERGRWYCYELMVKANTPGKNDGEVKYWIDGKVVSDFPDLFMRSISTLKIDEAHVELHAIHSERLNKKWYDNIVIATKYIGPMAPAATPTPTPSPTPTPAPSPSPSPTPGVVSVTASWPASPGATGYILVWGTESGNYTGSFDVGNELLARKIGFTVGTTYYFAVKAYNATATSAPSPEVSYTP